MVILLVIKIIRIEVDVHLSYLSNIVKINELGRTMGELARCKGVNMVVESPVCRYITTKRKRLREVMREVKHVFDTDRIAVI